MALFENFPYTNLHELNLDWLIQEMKELEQKVQDGPVVSVNGLTGVVTLYRESNIQFPDITDPTVTKWEMFRYLNGNIYGIQFDNNGNVYALRNFVRTKLLTWDDIPPEAGVISINDLYGVVHLSGTDIPYMGGETATVYDKLSDLDDDITSAQADINDLSVTLTTVDNAIKRGIAYLESTDTAVNNIPSGSYVFWKNGAYISTSAISVGDTLSSTNLSAVATGGFINAMQAKIDALNSKVTNKVPVSVTAGNNIVIDQNDTYCCGETIIVDFKCHLTSAIAATQVFATINTPNSRFLKQSGSIVPLIKGTEWTVTGLAYGYINTRTISTNNLASGEYLHVYFVGYLE